MENRITDKELCELLLETSKNSQLLHEYGMFSLPSVCQELLEMRKFFRMARQVDEYCRELERDREES